MISRIICGIFIIACGIAGIFLNKRESYEPGDEKKRKQYYGIFALIIAAGILYIIVSIVKG